MGTSAGNDEQTEGQDHPVKRDFASRFVNEKSQSRRDGDVGQPDQQVGANVQADHLREPEITMAVRHKALGGKQTPPPLRPEKVRQPNRQHQGKTYAKEFRENGF